MNRFALGASIGVLMATGMTAPAWAQYKVVGPDGRVTYTDRPPVDRPAQPIKPAAGTLTSNVALPFVLRTVVARYPVTLYTSANCAACDAGRNLLQARGVPFIEKTVTTPDDARAFQNQEGTDRVPLVRIGSKKIPGYDATEWASYLDMAGYPKQSQLPPGYRNASPSPMVPDVRPSSTEAPAPSVSPAPVSPPPTLPGGNAPSGFRF